jgi:hypothetical protein
VTFEEEGQPCQCMTAFEEEKYPLKSSTRTNNFILGLDTTLD